MIVNYLECNAWAMSIHKMTYQINQSENCKSIWKEYLMIQSPAVSFKLLIDMVQMAAIFKYNKLSHQHNQTRVQYELCRIEMLKIFEYLERMSK